MSKPMRWWINSSIMVKTVCTQIGLILLPILICILSLSSYIYADFMTTAAQSSYQYSRHALDGFEAQMLQIKASANVVLENREVRLLLTNGQSDIGTDLPQRRIDALLATVVSSRSAVQEATLFSTEWSGETAKAALPLWEAEIAPHVDGSWYIPSTTEKDEVLCYWVQGVYDKNKPVGVLRIRLSNTVLSNLATSIADIVGGDCSIYRRSGEMVYSTAEEVLTSDTLDTYLRYPEGYHALDWGSHVNVLSCGAMDLVFLSVCRAFPSTSFLHTRGLMLLGMLALLAVTALFTVWLHNVGVIRRIKLLTSQIRKVDSLESFRPVENVDGTDEIGMLAKSYNDMMQQIAELTRRERTAQMLQQTAKFNALQAQIQPHFLYNTLETLRMMADAHDDEEVADMLQVLGKLMRSSISGKVQETTLMRELENSQNYLKLIQLRFSRLRYEVSCTPEVQDFVCPRFILQPLVENSVQHGISRRRGDGRIAINVTQNSEFCCIDVQDNGAGIEPARLHDIRCALQEDIPLQQAQGGIGIINVHSRLKIFFGDESGLELFSTPGEGTLCRIRIKPEYERSGNDVCHAD